MGISRGSSSQSINIAAASSRPSKRDDIVLPFLADFPPPLVETSCFTDPCSRADLSDQWLIQQEQLVPEEELQRNLMDSSFSQEHGFADEQLLPHYCQVEPLDENYLALMENPPLYVNYLTDLNRRLPPLGSSPPQSSSSTSSHLRLSVDHSASPSISSSRKRRAPSDSTAASLSKREKIDLLPASSCCTSALNTDLRPRAKQGSANDPQSIAARQRRARISQRLKVLQSLVPNGSKVDIVTMLEKAINYVKFMQLQLQVLTTDSYWPQNNQQHSRHNLRDHGQAVNNSGC